MGKIVADDAVVAAAEGGQGERIRGGAVENEKHLALAFKNAGDQPLGARRPLVVTVGRHGADVGGRQRGQGFGSHAGRVVAGKGVVGGGGHDAGSVQSIAQFEQGEVGRNAHLRPGGARCSLGPDE
jgi:hypothetical protein